MASKPWYDKHRKCEDGNRHEGKLELIIWSGERDGTEVGWGNHPVEDSGAVKLKEKFETEFNSDEEKLYKYWPPAFRWTCCGEDADSSFGCDHHGSGSTPCTCDFCKMGEPLPAKLYNSNKISRKGLDLRRGPDARSCQSPEAKATTQMMRDIFGLPGNNDG